MSKASGEGKKKTDIENLTNLSRAEDQCSQSEGKIREKSKEEPARKIYQDDRNCILAHAPVLQMSDHGKRNPNQIHSTSYSQAS